MPKEKLTRRDFIKSAAAAFGGLTLEKIAVDEKPSNPNDDITGEEMLKILSDPKFIKLFGEPQDIHLENKPISNKDTLRALYDSALNKMLILEDKVKTLEEEIKQLKNTVGEKSLVEEEIEAIQQSMLSAMEDLENLLSTNPNLHSAEEYKDWISKCQNNKTRAINLYNKWCEAAGRMSDKTGRTWVSNVVTMFLDEAGPKYPKAREFFRNHYGL